jgi:hypothetical protein
MNRAKSQARSNGEEHIIGTPEFEQRWKDIRGKEMEDDGEVGTDDDGDA